MNLFFHLATDPVGMALVSGSRIIRAEIRPSTHEFTEHLSDHLDHFCRDAGLTFKDLKALCFTVGPGNYTGTRLGVSVGKTIAQALDIPLFTLSTLEAYVWTHWPHEGIYLSMIETRPPALRAALFRLNAEGVTRLTPDFDLDEEKKARLLQKFEEPIMVVSPDTCPDIFNGLAQFMGFAQVHKPPQPLDKVMPVYAYPPAIGGRPSHPVDSK